MKRRTGSGLHYRLLGRVGRGRERNREHGREGFEGGYARIVVPIGHELVGEAGVLEGEPGERKGSWRGRPSLGGPHLGLS